MTADHSAAKKPPNEPGAGGHDQKPETTGSVPEAGLPPIASNTSDTSVDSKGEKLPVSGESLIAWTFWYNPKWNDDPSTIPYYKQNLPKLRAAFEAKYGEITTEYYCSNFVGGYVLTSKDHLVTVNNESGGDASDVCEIIEAAERLVDDAHDCLDAHSLSKARRRCVELASYPISTALGFLDGTIGITEPAERATARNSNSRGFKLSHGQLSNARAWFDRVASRTAHLRYLRGVVKGLVVILALGILIAVAIWASNHFLKAGISANGFVPLLVGIGGGAFGALVSVMTRMTSGRLKIDVTAGETQLEWLGAFRPLIGAIFGAALASLILGEVLPISQPENGSHAAYFFASIGFLAGFSERWAQDMFSQSEDLLTSTGATSPSRADPAPQSGKNALPA